MKQLFNRVIVKITILFAVVICFISSIAVYGTYRSMELLCSQAVGAGEYNLELAINQVDAELTHIDSYLYSLIVNNADFMVLNSSSMKYSTIPSTYNQYQMAVSNLWNSMGKQLLTYEYIEALFVYTSLTDEFLLRTSSIGYRERLQLRQFIESGIEGERRNPWRVMDIGGDQYLARLMMDGDAMFGAFIRIQTLYDNLTLLENYDSRVLHFVNSDESLDLGGFIAVEASSSKAAYKIVGGISDQELYQNLPFVQKLALGAAIASFLCIPLMMLILKNWLGKPLNVIRKAMERIKEGDMDYKIAPLHTSSEFVQINETFNKMTGEIKDLTIENYEKKLEKQRADFQILQLKINPHFLLNSFNIMYSLAQIKDFQGVQKLCTYLSGYFRYIFQKDGEYVELHQELSFVRDYLNISALRFPECFQVDYYIDETLLEFKILPLMIQNFAENCIKYAIVHGDCINIRITAKDKGDYVEIGIYDNGMGMPQTMVDNIIAGEAVKTNRGERTGILNCKKRLKAFYGDKAQILLKSILNQGTEVLIHIPKEETGDEL